MPACRGQQQANDSGGFEFARAKKVGTLETAVIDESSGLVPSRHHPGMYWTHNDNGQKPGLFLIDKLGGHRATIQLKGARFEDWEDIVAWRNKDGTSFLMVADTGDNFRRRDNYRLYVLPEPKIELEPQKVIKRIVDDFQTIQFVYPDGSRDCEAVSIDLASKQICLITREFPAGHRLASGNRPEVYRLDWRGPDQITGEVLRAERAGAFADWSVTGADISADGQLAIIRNYLYCRVYARRKDEPWTEAFCRDADAKLNFPVQRQSEGICFDLDSQSILTTSESVGQPIWEVRILSRPAAD